ncbi:hypothetical protein GpartN1_g2715.t1 [Galdieria partita]|uniref:Histone deacetylase domain-containing protein n=1 Tax=Galdieria partita TaxID=83374 RepID=A0A9C7PVD3_9RHOD|nr:hypothetical protein GpartN1_g2715.t1 [Galdieria partita]
MFLFAVFRTSEFRTLDSNRILYRSLKCYRCKLRSLAKYHSTFRCQSNLPPTDKVALLYSDQFQLHRPPCGRTHPECPERVTTTMRHLESSPIFSKLQLLPFEEENGDDAWLTQRILSIHSTGYLEDLERWINQGSKALDADTYLCEKSLEVCKLAVKAWLKATQYSFECSKPSFVLARPPGHHATAFTGMGFCIFSNLAIAAKYAMEELGAERVSILDWDVHHGNGTASCFQRDERVRFASLHQFPFYPMTGAPHERGPIGNLFNITFESGADGSQFVKRLKEEAIPFLAQHKPDVIFVSAGYDALKMDPLGGLCLVPEDYFEMTRAVMSSFGHERIVFGLEGGYHLEETARAIEKTLQGILHGLE